MPRIIAYTYCADVHCPYCASVDAAVGILERKPPLSRGTDEHGIAFDLIDREGNPIRRVFSTDEHGFDMCSDCCAPL